MVKAGRGADQVMVRLPDGMRDRLKEAAEGTGRSANAEIVARLEQSFEAVANSAKIERLQLENRHMRSYIDLLLKQIAITEKSQFHLLSLMHLLSDAVKEFAEGDTTALDGYVANHRRDPSFLDFEIPEEPAELENPFE